MPCTITGSFEGDDALLAREGLAAAERRERKLVQMLCGICKLLEQSTLLDDGSLLPMDILACVPGLSRWWVTHQMQDAKKRAKRRKA